MYVHPSGVQKHAKFEKRDVFLVMLTNFGKDMMYKLRKKTIQKYIFRVYFHTWKICAYRVCFESTFTRMISSLIYKCPPPPPPYHNEY